jgi:hypothetical protein
MTDDPMTEAFIQGCIKLGDQAVRIEELEARLAAAEARADRYEAALREWVAAEDEYRAIPARSTDTDLFAANLARLHAAREAARAALAGGGE